jgi:exosortase/archaeosortase family protein
VFGAPALPVAVTLACSGTDALALCLGAIFAYPAKWSSRATGAVGGIALLLLLNTIRIGTLGRAVASPGWFNALHVFVWPALLSIAIAAYVFWWMQRIGIDRGDDVTAVIAQPSRRFIALTLVFLLLFAVTAPLYLDSASVLALAEVISQASGWILGAAGVASHVSGNMLTTSGGNFLVTQECIVTPLLPVYLAAIGAYCTQRRLVFGVLAAVPLFTALGVVRLLLVALPESLGSPIFLVHAFYQLLLGAIVVYLAAAWSRGRELALRYTMAAIAIGVAFMYWLGPLFSEMVTYTSPAHDPQGAIAFLPAFQAGLYLALSLAVFRASKWRPVLIGLAVLVVMQPMVFLALQTIADAGTAVQVRDVRAWAIAGPLMIVGVIAYVPHTRN